MKKILLLLPILAIMLSCTPGNKNITCPVLNVEGGQVQGIPAEAPGVYVFKGLPYAAAPIGDLRWKEPQPVVPWEGVRLCDKFGHPGYQAVHYPGGYASEWGYGDEAPYSEDCLYLNVWTKAPGQTGKKLPVALWIHGGGYATGVPEQDHLFADIFCTDGECVVYYRSAPLSGSAPFLKGVMVDGSVQTLGSQSPLSESEPNTIVTTYLYDGKTFNIELIADGVQTHNASDAIMSAWGVKSSAVGIG